MNNTSTAFINLVNINVNTYYTLLKSKVVFVNFNVHCELA